MSSYSLSGKTALVCGASQGIGAACAQIFAERGARVVLLARNQEKLNEVLKTLDGSGHVALSADLSDLAKLQKEILPQIEKLNCTILVNNSGGPKGGPLLEASAEEFEAGFRAHILAAQLLTKTVLPAMKSQKYGRVLNIISTSVKAPIVNLGVSNTIRAAMANWSKTLSQEVGSFGVTVNNVLPGFTLTPRLEALRTGSAQKLQQSEAQIDAQWKSAIPLGRFAEAREIAEALAFLASPAASYISGINLPVDGGRTPSL